MNKDVCYNEDFILGSERIPDGSVDMILSDIPYGVSQCAWDKIVDVRDMWRVYKRIIKRNGAIVLFADLKLWASLYEANGSWYRYDLIWEKTRAVGFLNANRMPLRKHEHVFVWYRELPTYNPQKTEGEPYIKEPPTYNPQKTEGEPYISRERYATVEGFYRKRKATRTVNTGYRYPVSVIVGAKDNTYIHSTQKPVGILEWLIRTYTHPGELVFDGCIGSGSTAVAALNTDRYFIGFEIDRGIYDTAQLRIAEAKLETRL
jgi:site-specific DNA-methyltransferase (adenine-specific)